ncbi:MAG: carbamoyltransferase HypF [Bacteroidales bacterium]
MSHNIENIIALQIRIEGLVQGVGFRPFVYRLAQQYGLHGWVANTTGGVSIKVEGLMGHMACFVEDLRYKAPAVSVIEEINVQNDVPEGLGEFSILDSLDLSDETSEISPDIAVCPGCIEDMKLQPHRIMYPFINCTNCGPRFSIIKDFPYDRAKTTMAPFEMCTKCREEYSEISDRRFHAQPVACKNCGPHYSMHYANETYTDLHNLIRKTCDLIEEGAIIAIKGIGGFHLMCDALNQDAVNRLRKVKIREGKPFAVMFRDIGVIKEYAEVSAVEEQALESWRRPVVILRSNNTPSPGISLNLNTLGAFLPYMPIHYLLFEKLHTPAVVLTSGNLSDEPILIDNLAAIETLSEKVDTLITHNREIYNRNDDSVVRVITEKESLFRRSRGYAPAPVRLGFQVDGILAAGAELSNCFCLGKDNRAYMSQHIGDLKNQETFEFFEETIKRYQQLFRVKARIVAADLHPDYLSTRFALQSGLPVIQVQHHHAHIASCMAENSIHEPVIGMAFDGTGYGTDGHIWGGEFLVCEYARFERFAHFEYMPLPGGDRVAGEPWRMGLSLLRMAYGKNFPDLDIPLLKQVDPVVLKKVDEALEKGINCPLSSGAGRLFDAVAALAGLCLNSGFHAEAPMRLESVIRQGVSGIYDFIEGKEISFLPAIRQICGDLGTGIDAGTIAAKFHNTVAEASLHTAIGIRKETGISKVALSGGTFQNKYLSELLEEKLLLNNFIVFTHSRVPCNDGGLALGQIAIAAKS